MFVCYNGQDKGHSLSLVVTIIWTIEIKANYLRLDYHLTVSAIVWSLLK